MKEIRICTKQWMSFERALVGFRLKPGVHGKDARGFPILLQGLFNHKKPNATNDSAAPQILSPHLYPPRSRIRSRRRKSKDSPAATSPMRPHRCSSLSYGVTIKGVEHLRRSGSTEFGRRRLKRTPDDSIDVSGGRGSDSEGKTTP